MVFKNRNIALQGLYVHAVDDDAQLFARIFSVAARLRHRVSQRRQIFLISL